MSCGFDATLKSCMLFYNSCWKIVIVVVQKMGKVSNF